MRPLNLSQDGYGSHPGDGHQQHMRLTQIRLPFLTVRIPGYLPILHARTYV